MKQNLITAHHKNAAGRFSRNSAPSINRTSLKGVQLCVVFLGINYLVLLKSFQKDSDKYVQVGPSLKNVCFE